MALNEQQLEAIQADMDDTRSKKERIDDQMSSLVDFSKATGEFLVDATPVVGDIKGAVELPEDVQLIQDLISEGYDEGSISKMGLGGLYGIATALGFIPAIGTAGDATKAVVKSAVKNKKQKPPKKPAFQPQWRKEQIERVKAKYADSSSRRRALKEINRPARKVFHGARTIGQTVNQDAYKQALNDLNIFNDTYVDIPVKEIFGDSAEVSVEALTEKALAGKNLRFPMVVNNPKYGPSTTYAVPKFTVNESGNYAEIQLEVIDPAGEGVMDTITNVVEVVDGKVQKGDIIDLAADIEIDSVNTVFPEASRTVTRGDTLANEGFKPYGEFDAERGLSGARATGRHFELKEKALSTSLDPLVSMKPAFGERATQNVVYSELPRGDVRDMSSQEYDDLTLFGGASEDAQRISPKSSNVVGAQLPKSRHLEAEVAITNPETLMPQRLGKGEVSPQFTTERGTKDIGKMDLEQRVAYGQRLANSLIRRVKDFQTKLIKKRDKGGSGEYDSAAEAVTDYNNLRTVLQDLQSLGNFTEQYGARGTYDSILEDLVKDPDNLKNLADALPKGEKKANALMLHTILDAMNNTSNSATKKALTRTRGLPDSLLLKLSNANDSKGVKLTKDEFNILSDANIKQKSDVPGDVDLTQLGYNDLKRMLFLQTDKFNQGGLVMNEGGAVPMKEQMEMFEDGGLKDEGGTQDPVSGNDVPVGSTQEEVRDDIPAQLSEGEFVLPADVVRYHGLDKIMALRDEAKLGLQRMEAMGQMGNSEEATIPDGVPFDVNDLDMEDDGVLEYNQGGAVMQPNFTGVQTPQPSQFQNYQGQYVPYQPAQPVQAGSQQFVAPAYQAPTQAPVPTMQQQQTPEFKNFIATPTGSYDELREYKNTTTGEVRQIPFVGGQPIYPIPEGFTYQDPEATTTEEVTTTPTMGQTQVQTTTGAGGERDDFSPVSATTAAAKSLGYETGTSSSKGLVSGLVGTLLGGPIGMLSNAIGFGDDAESTYGKPGTIDPATGAIFGNANIPGMTKNSPNVAQGFNPVTGQPMATFSGTPSASYMKDKIAMSFGFAENPNATLTGYQVINRFAPTPLAEQGFKSTADKVRENTAMQIGGPNSSLYGPTPVSPAELGFSKATAGYNTASKNTGTYGSNTGNITNTAFGLGVVNDAGQIETPSGTVVQKTDPTTGKKHSLLGSKQENKNTLDMIDKNIQDYHDKGSAPAGTPSGSVSGGTPSGNPADQAPGGGATFGGKENDGPSSDGPSSGSPGGPGSAPDGYGGGSMGGLAKGGSITKQMKKSGLSSKK